MGHMPAIPESTRSSIILRLLDHAEKNWPQLKKVQARYHGPFAYITGILPDGEQIPLFRLRYGGSAHSFGFAIFSAAHDRYQDAMLRTGLPVGTPRKPSTLPEPSTWPGSATNPETDPRRTYGVAHLANPPGATMTPLFARWSDITPTIARRAVTGTCLFHWRHSIRTVSDRPGSSRLATTSFPPSHVAFVTEVL